MCYNIIRMPEITLQKHRRNKEASKKPFTTKQEITHSKTKNNSQQNENILTTKREITHSETKIAKQYAVNCMPQQKSRRQNTAFTTYNC